MKEVHGTYNDALIYTDRVDDNALAQVQTLCSQLYHRHDDDHSG